VQVGSGAGPSRVASLNSDAASSQAGTLKVNTTTSDFERLQYVPSDEDTFIRTVKFATVGGISVRMETWLFDDMTGRSVIFLSKDVREMSKSEIVRMLQDAGVDVVGTVTFSRRETFCCVSFDFHD